MKITYARNPLESSPTDGHVPLCRQKASISNDRITKL